MQTTEKTCFKCGVTKPLTEFYAHKRMADGHMNKCKRCTKQDERNRRYGAGRERILAYDRARGMRPDRVAARKAYQATPNGAQKIAEAKSRQAAKRRQGRPPRHERTLIDPAIASFRRRARIAVNNALRDGDLLPWPACAHPEGCDHTKVEAHHPDYSRPLDVVWLCPTHHKQAHALARHFHGHQ